MLRTATGRLERTTWILPGRDPPPRRSLCGFSLFACLQVFFPPHYYFYSAMLPLASSAITLLAAVVLLQSNCSLRVTMLTSVLLWSIAITARRSTTIMVQKLPALFVSCTKSMQPLSWKCINGWIRFTPSRKIKWGSSSATAALLKKMMQHFPKLVQCKQTSPLLETQIQNATTASLLSALGCRCVTA